MSTIYLRPGENIDKALRLLKKKTAGLLREVRERQYFKKPSVIRREKLKEAIRKNKKKIKERINL